MKSTPYVLLFWTFAAISVASGVLILVARDIVRIAFLLMGALTGLAGLYLLLGAEFLAFIQVLVYIGGILVLLLFGVMLTHREPVLIKHVKTAHLVVPGILTALASFAALLYVIFKVEWTTRSPALLETPRPIGEALMTRYILPFEIASVLLLVALIGAAYIGRRAFERSPEGLEETVAGPGKRTEP